MARGFFLVVATGVLAGCSTAGAGDTVSGPAANEVPTFSGPWSSEVRDAYVSSTSDLQRRVLEDGRITEGEVGQLKTAFAECMSGRGLTVTWTGNGGGFDVEPADSGGAWDAVAGCEKETKGHLIHLQWSIQRNPDHQDEATIMASCMAAAGLVPKSYSAEEYRKDRDAQPAPSFLQDPKAASCSQDPFMFEK